MTTQIRPSIAPITVPRKAKASTYGDDESHAVSRKTTFTANATGTTTTIVGANATPSTEVNVVRLSDRFKLFDSADALKEDTVFHVTAVAVDTPGAGSTTVTFSPAAATAPVSGDYFRRVGALPQSMADLDARLSDLGVSDADISNMNLNDKQFALRRMDDVGTY